MSAFNLDGNVVNVGDRVSAIGVITAVSGTGVNTTLTIQPPLKASTISVSILDIYTIEGISCGAAQGNSAIVGNDCTVIGIVTAISGSGNTATLTVQLSRSGASVTLASGAVHSDNV
jgi:hypothetical protein